MPSVCGFHVWNPQPQSAYPSFIRITSASARRAGLIKTGKEFSTLWACRSRKLHPLEYLARFFDTTEINTSFYGPLKPEWAKLWCRKVAAVNKNFLFTAKLYRAFTHSPISVMGPTSAATIRPTDEDEERTREGLDALAGEGWLGALLIQFPLSFKNTSLNREYLDRLLRQFIEYPRVVEVRHSSWNDAATLAGFTQKNVGFCNIDQPQIGSSLAAHPTRYGSDRLCPPPWPQL